MYKINEIVKGVNAGTFRIVSFEKSQYVEEKMVLLKEVASFNHEIESPSPPVLYTLDMIQKIDHEPLTLANAYLIDIELHVEDATYHLSKVIRADSKEDALQKFEKMASTPINELSKSKTNKNHYLQVKSMYGLVADNLKLMTEI